MGRSLNSLLLLCLVIPFVVNIGEAKGSLGSHDSLSVDPAVGPPQSTPSPDYFPIVITALISAIVITTVSIIVASLGGLLKKRRNKQVIQTEKQFLDKIEQPSTADELKSMRKELANKTAQGSIGKEQFDFLAGRINQRFEEIDQKKKS